MTSFNSILAATDFSAPANNAVWRAARLAKQHGARLRIVHVVSPTPFIRVREWLAPSIDLESKAAGGCERVRKLAADVERQHDVTAELEVRTGDTFQELHHASARADLLVVGQRRRNPLVEFVLGRTAQRLIESCRRPVLVVRKPADGDYRRILVPIDLTPASDAAAVFASSLVPETDLQIFHAFAWAGEAMMREADVRASVIRDARAREEAGLIARMRRSMARLGLDSRRLNFALGRGSPVMATLRQAHALDADVLVATKHRRSRVGATVLGHVNSLLLRARCDMLVVPGRVRDPRQRRASTQRAPTGPYAGADRACATGVTAALRAPSWAPSQVPATMSRAIHRSEPRLADRVDAAAMPNQPVLSKLRLLDGQANRRVS